MPPWFRLHPLYHRFNPLALDLFHLSRSWLPYGFRRHLVTCRHGHCFFHDILEFLAHFALCDLLAVFINCLILKLADIAPPFALSGLDTPSYLDSPPYYWLCSYLRLFMFDITATCHLLLGFDDSRGRSRSLPTVGELVEGLARAGERLRFVHFNKCFK